MTSFIGCLQLTACLPFPQLENYIQDSMKQDIVQLQQTAVHNHTATMIEIGTNLLRQTAEQTRKLTNVEAQVRLHPTKEKKFTCYAGESQSCPNSLCLCIHEHNGLQHNNTIMKIRRVACEHTGQLSASHRVK